MNTVIHDKDLTLHWDIHERVAVFVEDKLVVNVERYRFQSGLRVRLLLRPTMIHARVPSVLDLGIRSPGEKARDYHPLFVVNIREPLEPLILIRRPWSIGYAR